MPRLVLTTGTPTDRYSTSFMLTPRSGHRRVNGDRGLAQIALWIRDIGVQFSVPRLVHQCAFRRRWTTANDLQPRRKYARLDQGPYRLGNPWPTLRAHLVDLAAETGQHPLRHLQEAASGRDLSTAGDRPPSSTGASQHSRHARFRTVALAPTGSTRDSGPSRLG